MSVPPSAPRRFEPALPRGPAAVAVVVFVVLGFLAGLGLLFFLIATDV